MMILKGIEAERTMHENDTPAAEKTPPKTALIVMPARLRAARLRRRFQRAGFDIQHARDGDNALQLLKEHRPDVVVCPRRLPDLSGFDLHNTVRRRFSTEEVLFVLLDSRAPKRFVEKRATLALRSKAAPKEIVEVACSELEQLHEQQRSRAGGPKGDVALSGVFDELGLFDLAVLLAQGKKTGQLKVITDGQEAHMIFVDGVLILAEFGSYHAEDAVLKIFTAAEDNSDTEFILKRDIELSEANFDAFTIIRTPVKELLLKVAVSLDEHRKNASPSPEISRTEFLKEALANRKRVPPAGRVGASTRQPRGR
ncbi:MAG: response regulator [Trueperaceae bacterium]|nr:MAG: response regulator [Trueperaceae bacterium]